MANLVYITGVHHPWRPVRILGMGLLFMACLARMAGAFARELLVLLAALLVAAHASSCSVWALLAAALISLYAWCCLMAARRVEFIAGHRAGAKGYTGEHCENTVEALRALVAADNGPHGPVPDLHYVEIDVQETADGELVVLHDFHLTDAFPDVGPNKEVYKQLRAQLANGSAHPHTPRVKDVTRAQLRSLLLAGRSGLHAPTLAEFLAAFRAAGCRRPLVVEVKALHSDAGREALLALLRSHQPYAREQERLHPGFRNPLLGFLAVIAFPNHFAASFGEFGGVSWRHWGARLAELHLPVRCCFLDVVSLLRGIPATV